MKKFAKVSFISAMAFVLPAMVEAADGVNRLIDQVQTLIARLIPIVIGLAVLMFLWGIIRYVSAAGDEDKSAARVT